MVEGFCGLVAPQHPINTQMYSGPGAAAGQTCETWPRCLGLREESQGSSPRRILCGFCDSWPLTPPPPQASGGWEKKKWFKLHLCRSAAPMWFHKAEPGQKVRMTQCLILMFDAGLSRNVCLQLGRTLSIERLALCVAAGESQLRAFHFRRIKSIFCYITGWLKLILELLWK